MQFPWLLNIHYCLSMNVPSPPRASQIHFIHELLEAIPGLQEDFTCIAGERAQTLREDHARVRDASRARGQYTVRPVLPVDIIGTYVFLPHIRF